MSTAGRSVAPALLEAGDREGPRRLGLALFDEIRHAPRRDRREGEAQMAVAEGHGDAGIGGARLMTGMESGVEGRQPIHSVPPVSGKEGT